MSARDEAMNFRVGAKEEYAARLAFFLPGFAIATWAPLIPIVKDRLNIEADVLGMLLLCVGISAFIMMPIAGIVGRKFGCRKVIAAGSAVMALDLVILSCLPNIWGYAVFLSVLGAFMGMTDVNMNINAVMVEKLAKKRMMSSMHAFWSIGGFAGAGLFSLLAMLDFDVFTIALIHCAILLVLTALSTPYFLPYKGSSNEKAIAVPKGIVVLFGVIACTSFLAEGAVMDWSGVFLAEVKSWDLSIAGLGYAVFSVAMMVIRLIGDKAVQLFGERKIVILGSVLMGLGFLLIVLADDFYLMMVPFLLLGLGGANVVPVLYSRLNHQKDMPISSAVTAVTCLGYTGVILGPAVLGFIAHAVSLTGVFILLTVLMMVQAGISIYVFCMTK